MIVSYIKKYVMILSSENVYYNMAHCQEHVSFNGSLTLKVKFAKIISFEFISLKQFGRHMKNKIQFYFVNSFIQYFNKDGYIHECYILSYMSGDLIWNKWNDPWLVSYIPNEMTMSEFCHETYCFFNK